MTRKHVMVDLETLSNKPDAAIISIGAVEFVPHTGEIKREFYERIEWESNGVRRIDASTVRWWLGQNREAIAEVMKDGGIPLRQALAEFMEWFPKGGVVWSNGATFDVVVLENAYGMLKEKAPWEFFNVRDVRTVCYLAEDKIDRKSFVFEGDEHHALHDAKHQVKYMSAMIRHLKGIET